MFNLYKGEQRMNRISGIKLLVAVAAICLVTATVANAAIVEIRLNLTTSTGTALPGGVYSGPGGTFTGAAGTYRVNIQVRVMNNLLFNDGTNDYIGGISFIGYDMIDSTGIVSPASLLAPAMSGTPAKWTTTANTVLTDKGNGLANVEKAGVNYDVSQGFAAIGPDDLGPEGPYNYDVGGSGQGGIPQGTQPAWVTAVYGNFTYSGGNAVLSLGSDTASLKVFTGVGVSGYSSPTSVNYSFAKITFGTTTANHAPKMDSVMTGGHAGPFTKDDWSQEPGWNNPLHTMVITAAGNDSDDSPQNLPLTFNWSITDGRAGGLTKNLTAGVNGALYNLTIGELANLWGGANLPQNEIEAATLWTLHVVPVDSLGLAGTAMDVGVYVPEPATIGLLAFGIVGLLRRRRA